MSHNTEVVQCKESENKGERAPSKYNLFHCPSGVVDDEIEWHSSPSPACSEISETALPRPTSSVQIKEVEFADYSQETSSPKRQTVHSQSREKKCAVSNRCDKSKGKEKQKEAKCSAPKRIARPTAEEKRQIASSSASENMVSNLARDCSNTHPPNARYKGATPHVQTFTESARQALQPHTKEPSAITHARGKLSDFFLSGVESGDKTSNDELGTDTQEIKCGKTLKPVLPISATVWLPDNNVFTEDKTSPTTQCNPHGHVVGSDACTTELMPPNSTSDRKPNPLFRPPEPQISLPSPDCLSSPSPGPASHSDASRRNPLLETSVYFIETDLPPPNRDIRNHADSSSQQVYSLSYSAAAQFSNTHTSATTSTNPLFQPSKSTATRCTGDDNLPLLDSESDTDENLDRFGCNSSSEEGDSLNEGYGVDSEALEDLAWELQSISGGRLTQCEGEEGVEEEEEEGEEGEELEAGFERIKSSFEMYQQQLMHQDSDSD